MSVRLDHRDRAHRLSRPVQQNGRSGGAAGPSARQGRAPQGRADPTSSPPFPSHCSAPPGGQFERVAVEFRFKVTIPKLTVRVRFPSPASHAKSVAIQRNWAPSPIWSGALGIRNQGLAGGQTLARCRRAAPYRRRCRPGSDGSCPGPDPAGR